MARFPRTPPPHPSPYVDESAPGAASFTRTFHGFEKMLAVQRPVVLAHIRGIRLRNPAASPAEVVNILERRYQAAVSAGGAAVGATAVIPGAGTAVTLALSGAETAGFLEASALFAQSVSEIHGIAARDPQRASALVMTMMLGNPATDLVKQLVQQAAGTGPTRSLYWGEQVMSALPQFAIGPLAGRLKNLFIRRFAATGSASIIGRAMPFGIGAVVGGVGNYSLARKVVSNARNAFGVVPTDFPDELEHRVRILTQKRTVAARARSAGERVVARVTKRRGYRGDSTVDTPAPDVPESY